MYQPVGKRILDLIIAVPASIFLAPAVGIIAISLRLCMDSGSPFFCQRRPGLYGKPFTLYKFRTMKNDQNSWNTLLPDSERLTRFGQLIRRVSLDEVPELWNVIKGEMSFVGPRPLLMEYLDRYSPEQARRHEVKPGITGWAQVNGRNAITWEEKFNLDVWYVANLSLWLDMKIIAMTVWKIIKREGISQSGQATMEEFLG